MIDYVTVLNECYPGTQWSINANDYDTLQWFGPGTKPTQTELQAQWPQAYYQTQCRTVDAQRRTAYEQQSDGLFFKWQRGEATQDEWLQAVAAVQAANPYPPAP